MKVQMFKMTYESNQFNKNQKVWIIAGSGAQAALCVGKHRGRGRYVEAWVHWGSETRPFPRFIEVDVSDAFAKQLGLSGCVFKTTGSE